MSIHAHEDGIGAQARRWVMATHDPAFAGWERLSEWLEQDPAHLLAYNEARDLDDWAAEILAAGAAQAGETPVNEAPAGDGAENVVEFAPRPRNRRWFLGVGMAAAIVAALGGWTVLEQLNNSTISTQPGERRTVQLADGSSVILNGGTTIHLDKRTPREVELAAGEALFTVRHDESDPFVVMAGSTRLLDAGTVFNVLSEDGSIDVAVAHGAVIYEPAADAIRLDAGQALHRSGKKARPVLRKADTATVGSWQNGTLQYDDATLDAVARDLRRNTGLDVRADPSIETLRFTGTLSVAGSPQDVFARVGPLLGVRFAPDGSAWKMMPADGSRP